MANPSWDDTEEIEPTGAPTWDDTEDLSTPLESAGRGLAQGASMGFADEISGGAEALWNKVKGNPEEFAQLYAKYRDESRKNFDTAQNSNPKSFAAGQVGGAIGTSFIPGLGGANVAKLAAMGALQGLGTSNADLLDGDFKGAARDSAIGGGTGLLAGGAVKALGKIPVGKALTSLSDKLKGSAENLAENATGATGRQAEKFAEGSGRELLDRGLVKFGDNAAKVAERVGAASDEAGDAIGGSLQALDEKGVTASADNIVSSLRSKIAELKGDPSQATVVRKLEGIIDDIIETGESSPMISAAEEAKRGFSKGAGNWMDPEAGAASKNAYLAYMDEVERAALEADPSLAGKFTEAKKTYGLLAPIKEAAEKRASTVKQSPFGGLGDMVAAGSGGAAGGPLGSVAGVIGKKVIAPRVTSSAAVSLDKIGDIVKASPKVLGKYAPILQQAAQRGNQAVSATHFILQSRDPEYRKMLEEIQDGP